MQKETCLLKSQSSVKIKITCSESVKHFPKTKSTVYFTNNNSKRWKVSKILRKKDSRPSACLPACLLAWYWQRNIPREFTENCFAVLDQSSRVIFLTWYCRLYFFPWIPRGYPLNRSVKDFLSNRRGVDIIQFHSVLVSFGSMYFFFIAKLRCYTFRKPFCKLGSLIGSLVIRV